MRRQLCMIGASTVLLTLLMVSGAVAQDADPALQDVIVEDTQNPSFRTGKLLRCPVCQGMPIAESPADMAQAMMARVREMHEQGHSQDEILQYFVDRYGEWVLLEPRTEGFNLLVWLLPPIFLLGGIFLVLRYARRSADGALDQNEDTGAEDAYIKAVREEVDW